MASIEKRGDKYAVRWRDAAGKNCRRTCPNLTTARALKREVEEDLALGAATWRPRAQAEAADLSVIFQAYLEDRARVLAPMTMRNVFSMLQVFLAYLREHVAPHGRLTPDLLSRANLSSFYQYAREVRGNQAASAAMKVRCVETAWRWAFDSDEFDQVTPRPKTLALPGLPPPKAPVAPTWPLCDAIIAAADRPVYRRFFTVLRYTGLRNSQVARLRWEDFDLSGALMTVRPELGKSRLEKHGRVVPISPHFVEALRSWGPSSDGWLLDLRSSTRRVNLQGLRRAWSAVGVESMPPAHAFRKAFVTGLIQAGVQEHVVKGLVGHARGITLDVYTDPRALMEEMRAAVGLMPKIGEA
ncbi:site-specific integrase [Myxococcota bacterium]|nr:site-specific integrase [Myxococcota bacterium]MBU1432253.1 site-specific integrase [Myxococcota bacterium]MBU1899809.1 site-specific integrase [Myxococcota bacterium]